MNLHSIPIPIRETLLITLIINNGISSRKPNSRATISQAAVLYNLLLSLDQLISNAGRTHKVATSIWFYVTSNRSVRMSLRRLLWTKSTLSGFPILSPVHNMTIERSWHVLELKKYTHFRSSSIYLRCTLYSIYDTHLFYFLRVWPSMNLATSVVFTFFLCNISSHRCFYFPS